MEKHYITIITAICTVFSLLSCESSDKYDWHGTDMINFADSTNISYSFVNTQKSDSDTIWVEVQLHGRTVNYDRSFSFVPNHEKTTAIEDIHYQALQKQYFVKAGDINAIVPIIVYDKDEQLKNQSFSLNLQLKPGNTFATGLENFMTKQIDIANSYTKPGTWDIEFGLSGLYGEYSKTKHEICIKEIGSPFPETKDELSKNRAFWRAWGVKMSNYFDQHEIIDSETNQRIEKWEVSTF